MYWIGAVQIALPQRQRSRLWLMPLTCMSDLITPLAATSVFSPSSIHKFVILSQLLMHLFGPMCPQDLSTRHSLLMHYDSVGRRTLISF